jgi:isoleucyl-tRNA synthetase
LLHTHFDDLPTWFIVSHVQLERGSSEELDVRVDRVRGDKCERCWKFKPDVGSNDEFPTVCASCAAVLPEFLS